MQCAHSVPTSVGTATPHARTNQGARKAGATGSEASIMTPQNRATANLAALAELLKPEPNPAILANYEGWADARVRNWLRFAASG